MYLARQRLNKDTYYSIRESYRDGPHFKKRILFELGVDPGRFIIYPGGNSYYYDEVIEDTLRQQGAHVTQEQLDDIFWEFLDPAVQRVINGFQRPF